MQVAYRVGSSTFYDLAYPFKEEDIEGSEAGDLVMKVGDV